MQKIAQPVTFWTKLYWRRLIHQSKLAARYHFGRRCSISPLFVIAGARSGSTLLLSNLRSLPEFSVTGEILNPWIFYGIRRRMISRGTVIRHIKYSLNSPDSLMPVAKILFEHLNLFHLTIDDLHAAFPAARFIVLYRRALGQQFVSYVRARESDQWWHVSESELDETAVHVDPEELRRYCADTKRFYADLGERDWLRRLGIALAYEDLVADPDGFFRDVLCPFLEIPACKVETRLKKQATGTLPEMVSNFEEVREALSEELRLESLWRPGEAVASAPDGGN